MGGTAEADAQGAVMKLDSIAAAFVAVILADCSGASSLSSPLVAPNQPVRPIIPDHVTVYNLPTANAEPVSVASGPDGNLWVTERAGDKIAKVTPAGQITEYALAVSPFHIISGPGHALWFSTGGDIMRITTAGVVTDFPMAQRECSGSYLSEGADGKIWFVDFCTKKIGKMSPNGTVKEFTIPLTSTGFPYGIAAGPDSNLWFTVIGLASDARIGKITTSGVVTEYASSELGQPEQIVSAPDGALYVADSTAKTLVKVTTSGAITAYQTDFVGGSPLTLAPGPSGQIWVADNVIHMTKFDTTTHIFSPLVRLPDFLNVKPVGMHGIAMGRDGDMWVTGDRGDYVAIFEK
jgi:streptogramin lyase